MQRREALEILLANTPSVDRQLSPEDVASLLGFSDKEIAMMRVYMQEDFNVSWVYLSDFAISKYLTKERTPKRYGHFYDQVLKPSFIENIDYFEVEFEHPIVQRALAMHLDEDEARSLNLGTSPARKVGGKKYYLVTGRCFKKLLMRSNTPEGSEHCDYYLRLEEVLSILIQYISEMTHRAQLAIKDAAMAAKDREIEKAREEERSRCLAEEKIRRERIQEVNIRVPFVAQDEGYVYMMRSPDKEGAVKIGKSTQLRNRASSHGCIDPAVQCYRKWGVRDVHTAEKVVHAAMSHFRANKTRESSLCEREGASGWFYFYEGMEDDIDKLLAMFMDDEDRTIRVHNSLSSVERLPHFTREDTEEELPRRGRGRSESREPAPSIPDPAPPSAPKPSRANKPWPPAYDSVLEKEVAKIKANMKIERFQMGQKQRLMKEVWDNMNRTMTVTVSVPMPL